MSFPTMIDFTNLFTCSCDDLDSHTESRTSTFKVSQERFETMPICDRAYELAHGRMIEVESGKTYRNLAQLFDETLNLTTRKEITNMMTELSLDYAECMTEYWWVNGGLKLHEKDWSEENFTNPEYIQSWKLVFNNLLRKKA